MEYTTRHLYFLGILTSLYYSINITGKWREQYSFQERLFKGHSGELPLRLLLGLGSVHCASVSKRVLMHKFFLHVHFLANQSHFHMDGFAPGLVSKQKEIATR